MEFGEVPLSEAEGAVLAHSMAVDGGRIRKGAVLTAADLERLAAAGQDRVWIARLGPEDVAEDAAAARLAAAIAPEPAALDLRIGAAGTGRVNLFATGPGIVEVDASAIAAINGVDPMITIATVPEWHRLEAGGMAATIKIIAYGVPEAALAAACAGAEGALRVRPAVLRRAMLIETEVGLPLGDKGRRALEMRLQRLGVGLEEYRVVPHRVEDLAEALAASEAEVLFVLTGSATSDPRDTAPDAVRVAGGTVERFGMPVDPGNLLFIGELGGRPVIGLPGCARSPALNGADWVLERVLCGVPVSGADIAAMGVGGLLKEMPSRPVPRVKGGAGARDLVGE
ncbi:molybdopterin-binding protein [Aestuariibius sp. 2305UL40-4]|uniref:molybdopterin-binding protein n=1 Tax=Aestuariibius violaceus TaxID=3234132 RepID=UPI00345E252B